MHSYGFDGVAHVEIAVGALARYQKYTFRTTAGVTSNHYQYSYDTLFGAQNSTKGCIEGIYMHSYGFDGVAHVEIAVGALARYQKYTFRTTAGVTSNH